MFESYRRNRYYYIVKQKKNLFAVVHKNIETIEFRKLFSKSEFPIGIAATNLRLAKDGKDLKMGFQCRGLVLKMNRLNEVASRCFQKTAKNSFFVSDPRSSLVFYLIRRHVNVNFNI